jgi:hypothetical protein
LDAELAAVGIVTLEYDPDVAIILIRDAETAPGAAVLTILILATAVFPAGTV